MSLNKSQIDELIDDNCGSNSVSYPVSKKTRDENLAIDKFISIAIKSAGRWQLDDTNHEDYPIIKTNLIQGQRDYSFIYDEQGNLILDIYKILVAQPDGTFVEIKSVDVQSEDIDDMTNGLNVTGIPSSYDKTGNGIFFDVLPSYSVENGILLYINREGSYFSTSDTTKKPGFAGVYHEYIALRPSYQYAHRHSKPNEVALRTDMMLMEEEIRNYYSNREKDSQLIMTAEEINSV